MIAETLHHRPFALTAAGILLGVALVAMGSVPLAAVGAALIVAGLLVPLIRFGVQGNTAALIASPAQSGTAPEAVAAPFSASWFLIKTFDKPILAGRVLRIWGQGTRAEGYVLPETLAAVAKDAKGRVSYQAPHPMIANLFEDGSLADLMRALKPGTSAIVAVHANVAGVVERGDSEGSREANPIPTAMVVRDIPG